MPIGNPNTPFTRMLGIPSPEPSMPSVNPYHNTFTNWFRGNGLGQFGIPDQAVNPATTMNMFQQVIQHLMRHNQMTQPARPQPNQVESAQPAQQPEQTFTPEQLQQIRERYLQTQPTAGSRTGLTPAY